MALGGTLVHHKPGIILLQCKSTKSYNKQKIFNNHLGYLFTKMVQSVVHIDLLPPSLCAKVKLLPQLNVQSVVGNELF